MTTLQFDGATYEPAEDHDRLARQLARVSWVMGDQQWRSLRELATLTSASEASVSARLRDLRKPRFGSFDVQRKRMTGGHFLYRVLPARPADWLPL